MPLFNAGEFMLHSGQKSDFIIDCDALSGEDYVALAAATRRRCPWLWGRTVGVPRGGLRFAEALKKHNFSRHPGVVIVDDVFTTGHSMEATRQRLIDEGTPYDKITGVVIFARNDTPHWVWPLFRFAPRT
jgi:orotate phosphoribosyltransferase